MCFIKYSYDNCPRAKALLWAVTMDVVYGLVIVQVHFEMRRHQGEMVTCRYMIRKNATRVARLEFMLQFVLDSFNEPDKFMCQTLDKVIKISIISWVTVINAENVPCFKRHK